MGEGLEYHVDLEDIFIRISDMVRFLLQVDKGLMKPLQL